MNRRTKTVVATVFLLSLVGCTNEEKSNETATNKQMDIPRINVTVGDVHAKPKLASFSIVSGEKELKTESETVDEMSEEINELIAEPKEEVYIYYNESEHIEKTFIRQWVNGTANAVAHKNNRFELPKEAGEYIYEILTYYENGNAQYLFKVDVAD